MSDTAEYSAVATNQHGTATSKAMVTVKSKLLHDAFFFIVLMHGAGVALIVTLCC